LVLAKLPTANGAAFDSSAEQHGATCHPETRVDLLDQIYKWADDPCAKTIFWLNGMAGTGKSTISRTVARAFYHKHRLGASFFFKRGDGDRGKAAKFFTTIASQLVRAEPALAVSVKEALDTDPTAVEKAMREQFEKLVLEPMSQISASTPSLVIVVDALDECEQDADVKLIIRLFSSARTLTSPRLRVLVTSRPELPIRLGFVAINGAYQDLLLHDIPEPVIEHDIRAYLESELVTIRDHYNASVPTARQLPPDWPGPNIHQDLVKMAIPLFIFAATVCRFLADRKCGNPAKQLKKVTTYQSRSQGSKLGNTYFPVLDQLVDGLSAQEIDEVSAHFQLIVGSIIILESPLSVSSLARILSVEEETISDRLDLLHSVLHVPPSWHSPVRLHHLSFRDFLVDPNNRIRRDQQSPGPNRFWIDEPAMHRKMWANCLRLMEQCLEQDICGLRWPGTSRSAIEQPTLEQALPPEVQYACLYWVYHLKHARDRIRDKDPIDEFLRRHFLHWLEALSLMGRVTEIISLVKTLQALLDVRYLFWNYIYIIILTDF
jgi:hypothetical protein